MTVWHNCYNDGWRGQIVDDAYTHPAKFARGLIGRIVAHGLDRGWWKAGDVIGDPFGGIGLGGVIAAYHGLRWVGVELESRFVELANRNFNLHAAKWNALGVEPPMMIQGDSREFARLVGECSAICTSPPWQEAGANLGAVGDTPALRQQIHDSTPRNAAYGSTPGQIGRLPAGNLDAIISSPPYAESVKGDHAERETAKESREARRTPGGSLGQSQRHGGYGSTDGNLGNLREGTVDACITSPPYEHSITGGGDGIDWSKIKGEDGKPHRNLGRGAIADGYGMAEGNLGNTSGPTYWEAVAAVYAQCRVALRPGGILVVIVKNYVKQAKIVPLCDDTHRLLLHLGFEPIERIRAMLVKTTEEPCLFGGNVQQTQSRKSFFRRLCEAKGSPPIDFEEILIVRRS